LIANVTGNSTADTFIHRLSNDGQTQWERMFDGGSSCGLYDSETGNLVLAGRTNENIPKIIVVYQDITPVNPEKKQPENFQLEQNYPNPFNATTNIRFQLANEVNVSVIVYNILGDKVRTLVQNERKQAGYYTVEWDGTNDAGHMLPSGTYLYHITAGSFTATKKMLLVK
jgi:hypothetical protein